jgi:uncharacterized SAM-binding protein YcdF (DUF218 family)
MKILIILGERLLKNGEMSKILIKRLEKANQIHNKYNKIIVSGGNVEKKALYSEALVMEKYLINNFDIPKNKIIKETKSQNTIENAIKTLKTIKKLNNVNDISVLTSRFHMKRTKIIFNTIFYNENYSLYFISSSNGLDSDKLKWRDIQEKKYLKHFLSFNF